MENPNIEDGFLKVILVVKIESDVRIPLFDRLSHYINLRTYFLFAFGDY